MTPAAFRNVMSILAIAFVFIVASVCVYFVFFHTPAPCNMPLQASCPAPLIIQAPSAINQGPSVSRDMKVLRDPLYPPLNRGDERTHQAMSQQVENGRFYQPGGDSDSDSFRLVGYLVSQEMHPDAGGNRWKMFGRMRDRNNGEYYIVPADKSIDLKIPLTQDTVIGQRLKDVYSLPKEMQFKSPLLNDGTYEYIEIPKTDFTNSRYL